MTYLIPKWTAKMVRIKSSSLLLPFTHLVTVPPHPVSSANFGGERVEVSLCQFPS